LVSQEYSVDGLNILPTVSGRRSTFEWQTGRNC